jgi:nucleoside-diphosphate-sugar epimerase
MAKAKQVMDFEPQVELEDGLDRYVTWYRELMSRQELVRS